MSRTLRESIALGAIAAVYERLIETDGVCQQVWDDGETDDIWNGPEVEEACCEAYQEVKRAMEKWAKEVLREP